MYCQNCGSPNNDGARFCRQCGGQLAVFNSPAPAERASVVHTTENVYPQQQIKSKKKKSKKLIAVLLIVAIIVSSVAVVAFTVDFEKLAMSDVEYYLYLEKKNAEDFFGKDFMNLFEKYSSFSAETRATASMSGDALDYDFNETKTAKVLERSEFVIETDYNGSDIINIDADWMDKNGSEVIDFVASFLDGQWILSSDSVSYEYYNIQKTLGISNSKGVLKKFFTSLYEHFGGFEEYAEVTSIQYDGKKADRISLYFDYVFFKDLTDFVLDYSLEDDTVLFFVTQLSFLIDGADWTKDENGEFMTYREALKENREKFYDYVCWWIHDKLEAEYVAVYDRSGNILNRELILREVEDDNEYFYKNKISVSGSGEKTSSIRYDGHNLIELSNKGGEISVSLSPDEYIEWDLSLFCKENVVDINLCGKDERYYCGYDSATKKSIYDDLTLNVDLKTEFSKYDFNADTSIIEKAKTLDDEADDKITESVERILDSFFESVN